MEFYTPPEVNDTEPHKSGNPVLDALIKEVARRHPDWYDERVLAMAIRAFKLCVAGPAVVAAVGFAGFVAFGGG